MTTITTDDHHGPSPSSDDYGSSLYDDSYLASMNKPRQTTDPRVPDVEVKSPAVSVIRDKPDERGDSYL